MKKVALLFPGVGSQYEGMGKHLYSNHAESQAVFQEASDALGTDMKRLCFNTEQSLLNLMPNAQPAIFTVSMAAFQVYQSEIGIQPQLLAGHSLGEYTALTCAGALSFVESIKLLHQRGLYMQEMAEQGAYEMLAVRNLSHQHLESIRQDLAVQGHSIYFCNDNAPQQWSVTGERRSIEVFEKRAVQEQAQVFPLFFSTPSHTPLMSTVADKLLNDLQKCTFHNLEWPVISNLTGLPYEKGSQISEMLRNQFVSPVKWRQSMSYLKTQKLDGVVELGPKTILKNLAHANGVKAPLFAFDIESDIKDAKMSLSGQSEIPIKKVDVIVKALSIATCTRNENWDQEEYYQGVVVPFQALKVLLESIEEENREPLNEEIGKSITLLKKILRTKKVSPSEQAYRYKEIQNLTIPFGLKITGDC